MIIDTAERPKKFIDSFTSRRKVRKNVPLDIPFEVLEARSLELLRSPKLKEQADARNELIELRKQGDELDRREKDNVDSWGNHTPEFYDESLSIHKRQQELVKKIPKSKNKWKGRELAFDE